MLVWVRLFAWGAPWALSLYSSSLLQWRRRTGLEHPARGPGEFDGLGHLSYTCLYMDHNSIVARTSGAKRLIFIAGTPYDENTNADGVFTALENCISEFAESV